MHIAIVLTLLLVLPMTSCVGAGSPGLLPPVQDTAFAQWNVLRSGFLAVHSRTGEVESRWSILARFVPEETGEGLSPLDIAARMDGVGVPFTFEEGTQLFECVLPSGLDQGRHTFEVSPSDTSRHIFPTLTVPFEVP